MLLVCLLVLSSSGGDGALVEQELPAVVAEDPEGGTVGDDERRFRRIGGKRCVLCQRLDVVVADGGWAGFALEQSVDHLLAIEDAAGDAELFELLGEERDQGGAIAFTFGMSSARLLMAVSASVKSTVMTCACMGPSFRWGPASLPPNPRNCTGVAKVQAGAPFGPKCG